MSSSRVFCPAQGPTGSKEGDKLLVLLWIYGSTEELSKFLATTVPNSSKNQSKATNPSFTLLLITAFGPMDFPYFLVRKLQVL